MTVIKTGNSICSSRVAALDLDDLGRQAERIVADARQAADLIIEAGRAAARREIAEAREAGRREGLEEGRAEGREEGLRAGREQIVADLKPELERITAAWDAAVRAWEADRSSLLRGARDDVLAFAVAAARKIVFRAPRVDPTVVADQVTRALELLSRPTAAEVAVHPEDRPLVEEVLPDLIAGIEEARHIRLHEDDSMSRGGCIVRTAGGEVDATLETQIERLAEAMLPAPAEPPRTTEPA